MASADLRKELECSVCLNIYTDPVTLVCGHNFCRDCVGHVLETQEESGSYSCPECREEFEERPALHRNLTLRNIVENFLSKQVDQEETGTFCTQCIHVQAPAVKFCLLCEAYLCDGHLSVHSKSLEHVLYDPRCSLEGRKFSVHKKILEYYRSEDSARICVSCTLAGEPRKREATSEVLEDTKLSNVLQKLISERQEVERRVQRLHEQRRKVQEKACGATWRAIALFKDLRRQLEDLEKSILSEISGQAERVSLSLSDVIQTLEARQYKLTRKMRQIEELCNMTDLLTVLQEPDTGDLCDAEDGDDEDRERPDEVLHDGRDLDMPAVSQSLLKLSNTIKGVNLCFFTQEASAILLDLNTANSQLQISNESKTVSWTPHHNRPESLESFQDEFQVLSCQGFSSGRHYCDVEIGGVRRWKVGLCYPSMDRTGYTSQIGINNKSWCLEKMDKWYVVHDNDRTKLTDKLFARRVRIYLDYEAGRISFYDLCDPIRHLHTFTSTFSEPLHVGLCLFRGCMKIC